MHLRVTCMQLRVCNCSFYTNFLQTSLPDEISARVHFRVRLHGAIITRGIYVRAGR